MNEPKVQRALTPQWAQFMAMAESIKYGSLEKIEVRDGKPRFVRLVYDMNLDDSEDLKKKFDELRTLPL